MIIVNKIERKSLRRSTLYSAGLDKSSAASNPFLLFSFPAFSVVISEKIYSLYWIQRNLIYFFITFIYFN